MGMLDDQSRYREMDKMQKRSSLGFKKNYDGFAFAVDENEKGKRRLKQIYVADYYVANDEKRFMRAKILYSLGFIAAAVMSFYAMLSIIPSNEQMYIFLPEAFAFILYVVVATSVFSFAVAPKKLTINQYRRCSRSLVWYSFGTAAPLLVAGVGTIVHRIVCVPAENKEILLGVFMILSAGYFIAMALVERKREYHTVRSDNVVPAGVRIVSRDEE